MIQFAFEQINGIIFSNDFNFLKFIFNRGESQCSRLLNCGANMHTFLAGASTYSFYLMQLRVLDFRFFQDSNYMVCKQFDNDRLERINEPELISRLKSSTMNCRRFFSKGKFLFRKCKGSSLEMPGESSMNVQKERV